MRQPRYPVYVPTKGRSARADALTIRFLLHDGVPFHAVVEAEEQDAYEAVVGRERLLVLPESGQGLIYARNWIRDHAEAAGHARHWQLDDNIRWVSRQYHGQRIQCAAGPALAAVEDFTDRYENVALTGLNYEMFAIHSRTPLLRNVHVYSATLVNHACPCRWRLRHNDDTDLCLQVLAAGWCTVLVNAFLVHKVPTMTRRGGNTDDLYQGDGRLVMARSLERLWPGVVKVKRRYGRPQHVVDWRRFTTPLRLKSTVNLQELADRDEYGLELAAVRPVKSRRLRDLQRTHAGEEAL